MTIDVEAERGRELDLRHVADAAVAGDDEPDAGIGKAAEARLREAVALGQPGRHVAERIGSQAPQGGHPHDDRGHAIGVVVTPDRDSLTHFQGGVDPVEGAVRIGHARQIMERAGARGEEGAQLVIVA